MKKKIVALIAIITASAAIIAAILLLQPQSTQEPQGKAVKVTGTIACLPHKGAADGRPHTLECAIGIKTTDNKFYALEELPEKYLVGNQTITIEGTIDQTNAANYNKYDIAGVIKIQKVQE